MSDDGFPLLQIILGIGISALLIGLLVGAQERVERDQSIVPVRVAGYTPVQLASSDWNQIPASERTAFGATDAERQIVMIVTGTRDKRGVCTHFIEEVPALSKDELIASILTNPEETGYREHLIAVAEACYGLYPSGIGEAPEVLAVTVSNVSDRPTSYNPCNFNFRQDQRVVPIAGCRLLGQEKFMLGGALTPGESIAGCVLLEDALNFDHAFQFWYAHNYGVIENF